jgi:hypothetical protein
MDEHAENDPDREPDGADEPYADQQGLPSPDDPLPTPPRRDAE